MAGRVAPAEIHQEAILLKSRMETAVREAIRQAANHRKNLTATTENNLNGPFRARFFRLYFRYFEHYEKYFYFFVKYI